MTEPLPAEFAPLENGKPETNRILHLLRYVENLGVTLALMAMMLLPVLESVLRKTSHAGISGASQFVQQLTLIVGMLGGAIAARDGRLLALSTFTTVLHGRWKT